MTRTKMSVLAALLLGAVAMGLPAADNAPAPAAPAAGAGPGMGPGSGMGPGMGQGMGQGMGPGAGMGPGMHQGMGPGMGGPYMNWHMNRGNTPGYMLMTPEERTAHLNKMRSLQSADECNAYMTEHRAKMTERAKEKGAAAPPMRGDPCRMTPATPPKKN